MKNLRVLVVTAKGLIPPEDAAERTDRDTACWKMEHDVMCALLKLGHDPRIIDVLDDLGHIRNNIEEFKPHIVFNLLHEFHNVGVYDHHVAAYLELLRQPYTGCNPRGLLLAHDKVLAKKLMMYHRIPTPRFATYARGKKIRKSQRLEYPLLVKSSVEDASLGISQKSVVDTPEKLKERVEFVHEHVKTDALVEEYVDGRELYIGVLGNQRLETLPVWEVILSDMPDSMHPIATRRVKWDEKFREKHGIRSQPASELPEGMEKSIAKMAKKIYRTLFITGYARLDCRLRADGTLFCLEADANPDLSADDEFALSAQKAGVDYSALVQRLLTLGLRYKPDWKQVNGS